MILEKFKWMPSVENFCSIISVNLQSVSQEVSQGCTPKHSVLSLTVVFTRGFVFNSCCIFYTVQESSLLHQARRGVFWQAQLM